MASWLHCFIVIVRKYLQLNDIDAYRISYRLSNYVWEIVVGWDFFTKDTVGKQLARAVDSISANIAEGFGRYSKKDKVNFYRYSFGSVKESLDWNEKARARRLLNAAEYGRIFNDLQQLPKLLHQLIRYTNEKLKQ